jgi:uncharacterized protein YjdB
MTGMSPLPSSVNLTNVVSVYNNNSSYAALKLDGSVVTWGSNDTGGNSNFPSTTSLSTAKVVRICNSGSAFAALTSTGNVITWGGTTSGVYGGNSSAVTGSLTNVVAIYSNNYAFAALKNNGQVITWGDSGSGGTSSSVSNDISANVVAVYSTSSAFTAVRKDGRAVVWGASNYGGAFNVAIATGGTKAVIGGNLNSGITSVNNTSFAFAAIRSTATTFDLSASYYTDNDRYDILRNKENRRRVNLTTLNNNVFTFSSARDIERFNYTIPSGAGPFRIIVPDFVDSNYSITSTASIPSPAAANYIIACEEGEPVTISGTTYINYGAFVYLRNADNTFTKMPSVTIGGLTYNAYGGDGINSSGIALRYRFGAFTVPEKTFGDASFNLTAPVTDSSGSFTYTSSNTRVATVTSGGTVTMVAAGTTTITATQAASGSYPSDSITATLTVNKGSSTLGALTVPAKIPGDAPFTLTAPTSSISSIISPTHTITSTTSVIVPPPDILDISYGTVWGQLGLDISGTQVNENSGYSVSLSADGTIVAIGSYYYDKAGGTTNANTDEGRTRVYKYNGTSWTQLGLDISGTQVAEYSGVSVTLSADGKTLAIGSYGYDMTGTNSQGRTRIYNYNGTSWTQLGLDISGTQVNEQSGYSVSLSADGTIVAIGSYLYDKAGGTTNANTDEGRTRIYKYNGTSWAQLGLDISGNQTNEYSGVSVSLSEDGTTVAIGSYYYDVTGTNNQGRARVYKYNSATSLWGQLGLDISGTQVGETCGSSVSLSADGTIVAIGSPYYDVTGSNNQGRTRVYKYNGTSWGQLGLDISGTQNIEVFGNSVSLSADGTIVAIGSTYFDVSAGDEGRTRIYRYNGTSWVQLGLDISGNQVSEYSGWSVSLSADGTTVAVGAYAYDKAGGTTNSNTQEGRTRIYRLNTTTNALTYSSSSSSIADVCGNLLLIKGVNGTSTITASQTGNTVTGRLDVSGTTYTLQYNPLTFSISDASLATVSTYGTVTLTGTVGTSTITATQPETLNYASRSVSGTLDVSGTITVLGDLTIPTKMFDDASFNITQPTTNNPSGAFTYTSSNTSVATVTTNGVITITGIGTTTITATQASSGIYTTASVSGSLVVNFGNTNTITLLPTDTALVIPTPVSNVATTYGSLWNQLGADIVGKVSGDESGTSVSVSADGTIVAIGARSNTTNRGTVRVYKYNDVSWNQLGTDIDGEASSDYSGQSVSLSANGRVLAIGANTNDGSGNLLPDSGHVRIYEFNGTNWVQRGGDIDGEANGDQSGFSVSLSADGSTVAIGAFLNDGSGNALSNSGHVRVYRYNASKSVPQLTDESLSTFGPAGWDRLGGDIDGEAVNDQSGFSVSLSANGSVVAIGAIFNDGTSGTVDTSNNRGHVRVYRYNASKTSPQLTDQTLSTFGPVGWDRMGSDIDGEVAADQSGFSVSLSSNGAVLAIGSPFYDVSGVSNSGRVRVFGWNGSSWAQRGQNINGVNLNENMGDSVSLSADGNILSVSSFMKVVSYNYNSSTDTWNQIGSNVTGSAVSGQPRITNSTLYSPHVYLDATNSTSYNRSTNTWTNIGSLGGNVVMTYMGTFDASDNGGSFNFNGSGNRGQITVPSTTLTSLTYVAVVKTTRLNTGWATIVEFGSDNLLFGTSSNILNVYPRTSSGFSPTANVWYVVAATITSGGTITYYVNGVSVLTATNGALNTANTVYGIGSGIGGNEYWNGKIAALAIYHNRVLTASEIANISNNLQTYRVNLSSIGNILAIGAREYHGTVGTSTNIGVARVYRIDTSGNYTYSINNTAIADVCGNIILPKSISGSTTIGITQSASGATASRSGTIPFSVSLVTTTITRASDEYSSGTISKTYEPSLSFSVSATSSRGVDSAVTYSSNNTEVATVNASTGVVTVLTGGTAIITASQTETTEYTAGSTSWTLNVALATTVITRASDEYSSGTISKTYEPSLSFSVSATSSRGVDSAVTYSSNNTEVATVNASTGVVTVLTGGTAIITASQTETTEYTSGSTSWALTVALATTVITRSSDEYSNGTISKTYEPSLSFSVSATSSRGVDSAVTYSSNNTAVATVNASTGVVTVITVGTASITASQTETSQYTAGSTSWALTVGIATTVITRASDEYSSGTISKTYGPTLSFSVSATSSRGVDSAVTYSSNNTAVATVNASTGVVTVLKGGTAIITASQIETTEYTAGSTSWTLNVGLAPNVITRGYGFTDTITRTYDPNVTTFNITATSDNTFSDIVFTSNNINIATIEKIDSTTSRVTVLIAGTVVITASQVFTDRYLSATNVTSQLVINRRTTALFRNAPYNISSSLTTPYGYNFNLLASSISQGSITYESDNSGVAVIHPTTGYITFNSLGNVTITATQADSDKYTTPLGISWNLTVVKGNPVLMNSGPLTHVVTSLPTAMIPSSPSDGAYTYTLVDPSAGIVTLDPSSGMLTFFKTGQTQITISQAESALYLAPSSSITVTLTVTPPGDSLENTVIDPSIRNFNDVDLEDATLVGASITGNALQRAKLNRVSFVGASVTNAIFDNAMLTNANFTGVNLVGSTFAGATLTGVTMTNADISGVSMAGAVLTNANLSGANITRVNFTNANISGAIITGLNFAPVQKLQLLKNTNNREIVQIQIPEVTGDVVLSVISDTATISQMPNIQTAVFKVFVPETSTSPTATLTNVPISEAVNSDAFYLPVNDGEYFQINNVKYHTVGTTVKNYATNETVDLIVDATTGKQYRLFVGSVAGVQLQENTLSQSTFAVPAIRLMVDTDPIFPTTFPTSNSNATIVYSSNNTSVATINSSTGQITMVAAGTVTFTATQQTTLTHTSGSIVSNQLTVYNTQNTNENGNISFTLTSLNTEFTLGVSGECLSSLYNLPSSDATTVFYVKVDDMRNVFKFQSDSIDIDDTPENDIKYYVFKQNWPSTIKLNPAHSMVDVAGSSGMMGTSGMFASNKSLLKHDFIRYMASKLFNTIHGVDLFNNESALLENLTMHGENIRNEIENKLQNISATSSDTSLPIDDNGFRYLTNAANTTSNITRELMKQISASNGQRFTSMTDTANIQSVPLLENDTFNILITVNPAANQNNLTGVNVIEQRVYNVKIVLKNDITGLNIPVIDSDMYPNAYPYSANSVIVPFNSSANYNEYSPPSTIPVSKYGFNGWYYKNSSAWVSSNANVRNKIKWSVSPNTASSTGGMLQYIRVNLKVHSTTTLPYIKIYTDSSIRAYEISNAGALTANAIYTFYMNFNDYATIPSIPGHTSQALSMIISDSLYQGYFQASEIINMISLETSESAAYDAVEFTASSITVGDTTGEKDHWLSYAQ